MKILILLTGDDMNDNGKIKHLEFIQNIIDRHNRNSFQIKFGTITIISALLAIYADKGDVQYILLCIVPLLGGCILDSIYLRYEKCFRDLYNDVRADKVIDYDLSIDDYKKKYTILRSLMSSSIKWMYILLIVLLLILWA